jgi:hypothetical protein
MLGSPLVSVLEMSDGGGCAFPSQSRGIRSWKPGAAGPSEPGAAMGDHNLYREHHMVQ